MKNPFKNNKNLIIAVDWDNTIAINNAYGDTIGYNYDLVAKLKELQSKGSKIILWTCREGDWLKEAIEEAKQLELVFDAINESINVRETCGIRKVIAHVYIDDRAIQPQEFLNLTNNQKGES